jgi:hypothetical protein
MGFWRCNKCWVKSRPSRALALRARGLLFFHAVPFALLARGAVNLTDYLPEDLLCFPASDFFLLLRLSKFLG